MYSIAVTRLDKNIDNKSDNLITLINFILLVLRITLWSFTLLHVLEYTGTSILLFQTVGLKSFNLETNNIQKSIRGQGRFYMFKCCFKDSTRNDWTFWLGSAGMTMELWEELKGKEGEYVAEEFKLHWVALV